MMNSAIQLVIGLVLLSCLGRHPYSYYMVARWFATAGLVCLALRSLAQPGRLFFFLVVAGVFQPIMKIHLQKSTWDSLDLLFGAILICDAAVSLLKPSSKQAKDVPMNRETHT